MAGVSSIENKHIIRQWLIDNRENFKTVLDIGCGVGTYSLMGRFPEQHWTGLEVFEPYVEMFNLAEKYDELIIQDVRTASIGEYDLILAPDFLEHMPMDDAKQVIRHILRRSKTALICVPVMHCDQEPGLEGNDYERHIDHWTAEEMRDFLGDSVQQEYVGDVSAYS